MTLNDLVPITPLMVLSGLAVLQMLAIAIVRSHALISRLTLLGLLVTLASFKGADFSQVHQVTSLITVDGLGLFFMLLMVVSCTLVVLACGPYVDRLYFRDEFYLLLVLATLGACILVVTEHLVGFFLGLEILGIALIGLIAYPVNNMDVKSVDGSNINGIAADDSAADTGAADIGTNAMTRYANGSGGYMEAALKFFIMSATATAFVLMGMAFFYANTGSFLVNEALVTEALSPYYTAAAICLLFVGIGFKLSLVPFQFWTPDVYDGAPMPIVAFIASVSKGAVLLFLLRFFTNVFSNPETEVPYGLVSVISLVAAATILAGNFMALLQTNIKRLLGYSSMAHMGYIMVLFVALLVQRGPGSSAGLDLVHESLVFYVLTYLVTMVGVFILLVNYVKPESDQLMLEQLTGLFWRSPLMATLLTVFLLSLAGIPLTAGFLAKFYIFGSAIDQNLWFLIAIVILGSGVGLFYYMRIVLVMTKNVEDVQPSALMGRELMERENNTLGTGLVTLAMALLVILFGVYPQPVIAFIRQLV